MEFLKQLRIPGGRLRFRMIALSIATGCLSGIAAVILLLGLAWMSEFCQGALMGVPQPHAHGEHLPGLFAAAKTVRPWLIVLLPALGGLFSGAIVYTLAPEAAGHGMDAMIRAFHPAL